MVNAFSDFIPLDVRIWGSSIRMILWSFILESYNLSKLRPCNNSKGPPYNKLNDRMHKASIVQCRITILLKYFLLKLYYLINYFSPR